MTSAYSTYSMIITKQDEPDLDLDALVGDWKLAGREMENFMAVITSKTYNDRYQTVTVNFTFRRDDSRNNRSAAVEAAKTCAAGHSDTGLQHYRGPAAQNNNQEKCV